MPKLSKRLIKIIFFTILCSLIIGFTICSLSKKIKAIEPGILSNLPKNFAGFGVDPNNPGANPNPAFLSNTGVGLIRVVYKDNQTTEKYINDLINNGIKPVLVVNWEANDNVWTPGGIDQNYVNKFSQLADTVSQKYGNNVFYQIWNEPDGTAGTISLSPQEYAAILSSTYQTIKENDPNNFVLTAGLVSGNPDYLKQVKDILGGKIPADGIGLHPYVDPSKQSINDVKNLINSYYSIGNLPIWITEFGWETKDYQQQAAWLTSVFSLLNDPQSKDMLQTVMWYAVSDRMKDGFGLFDANGNIKPAFEALLEFLQNPLNSEFLEELKKLLFPFPFPSLPPASERIDESTKTCENPNAVPGLLRPEPCDGCGEELKDNLDFTLACIQTPTVSQNTSVYVGKSSDDTGEIQACESGSSDGDYFFMRNWGGTIEIDVSDTKVPFVNYHDKQSEQEVKYLAAYLTGTYGRYGAKCDIDDPECVKQIFRESGVLSKLLPKEIQDQLRCDMIGKIKSGQEYNYAVWNGQEDTLKMTVDSFSLKELPCQKDLYTQSEYQNREAAWQRTDKGKNWPFIPLVTYKDAPGSIVLKSQGPPGVLNPNHVDLSVPHLGTLYEATKILQTALTPKYQESELSSQKTQPILIASAGIDRQLESGLASSESLCGYQQVLGEQTKLLAQAAEEKQTWYQILINPGTDHEENSNTYNLNWSINFGRNENFPNISAYDSAHVTFTLTAEGETTDSIQITNAGNGVSFSQGLTSSFSNDGTRSLSVKAKPGQQIRLTLNILSATDWGEASKPEYKAQGASVSVVCDILEDGSIDPSTCKPAKTSPPEQPKHCGNPDTHNPESCQDSNAEEDTENPNDPICSNPFPIKTNLIVNSYSAVMGQDIFQSLMDLAEECRDTCANCALYGSNDACNKCDSLKPCDWQNFPISLTRDIGADLYLPYLEQIGQMSISDYYYYTDKNGNFDKSPQQQIAGLFDIFRPPEMEHYEPLQGKSNLKYSYSNARADWEDLQAPAKRPMVQSPSINPEEGDFYFPWLGGVQKAKKCVSENLLLPEELQKGEYFCPEIQQSAISN